jgi:hypothetical protein
MLSSLRRQRRLGTDYSGSFGYGGKRNLEGSLSEFPSEFFTREKLSNIVELLEEVYFDERFYIFESCPRGSKSWLPDFSRSPRVEDACN